MGSRYRQIEVSTARPEVLVARLLGRAVSSIQRAADPRSAGVERTQALAKAVAVIAELRSALDLERGGEVARNLE
ncbi:MAG: flagellar protein FliS, partial [Myxococcota bacterium]